MTVAGNTSSASVCGSQGLLSFYGILWLALGVSVAFNINSYSRLRQYTSNRAGARVKVEWREVGLYVLGKCFAFTATSQGDLLTIDLHEPRDNHLMRRLWKTLDDRFGFVPKANAAIHSDAASTSSSLIYGPPAPPLQMVVEHTVRKIAGGYTVCYHAQSDTSLQHSPAKDDPQFEVIMYPGKKTELNHLRGQRHVPVDGDTFVHDVTGTSVRQIWIFAHDQWLNATDMYARWLTGATTAKYRNVAAMNHGAQAQN